MDMRLPASLMQKYMLKAAEFYIGYVTRGPSPDVQIQGKAVDVDLSFFILVLTSAVTLNLQYDLSPYSFYSLPAWYFCFCSSCSLFQALKMVGL